MELDIKTSERPEELGMYRIDTVKDAETGKDLTGRINTGLCFNDDSEGKDLLDYLKSVFGPNTTIKKHDPKDHPDWPFKR